MAESGFQDKTEQATPKKREDARKKGQVARSREIPSVAVLMVGLGTLYLFGSYMQEHMTAFTQNVFTWTGTQAWDTADFMAFGRLCAVRFLQVLAPLFAAVFVTALFSNVLQVGVLFSLETVTPKFSKIDPFKGAARLFSWHSLVELLKSLLKLGIVGTVAYLTFRQETPAFLDLADMEVVHILGYIVRVTLKIFFRAGLVMVFIAALDFAFQKWQHARQLRMTKQEVKEEFKQSEGDPMVKARIRRIQQDTARKRMMAEVPKADVVVTNPTHLAVALRYDGASMSAPKVVAKGAGKVAEKIRLVAARHGVPLVENKELARRLYQLVDLGQTVPGVLFQAVAEVLAYVYTLKRSRQYGSAA